MKINCLKNNKINSLSRTLRLYNIVIYAYNKFCIHVCACECVYLCVCVFVHECMSVMCVLVCVCVYKCGGLPII